MFYRNLLKTKKTKTQEFEFDLFSLGGKYKDDENSLKTGEATKLYNFITKDGCLKSGYGFKKLAMPESSDFEDLEKEIAIRGNEVKSIWKLKWYNSSEDSDRYYLFYFNDENKVCYDNMFEKRFATLIINTDFSEVPYACNYRPNGEDTLLLSGDNGKMMVIANGSSQTIENMPQIISCCSHYGKLFAITKGARGRLIYNEDNDILSWSDEKTKNLDFSDERGDLNKIISFDDYIYLFRDFGITKVSVYSSSEEFAISHMYQADNYIYPNSIAESGDYIYFLQTDGIKMFNGSSVKAIHLDFEGLIENIDNRHCFATCFNGKYYLACRGDFKDNQEVGCENGEYINNLLIIYDIASEHVDITRGVDIKQLLALINPYKSKLVACFNNDNKDCIGELVENGKNFESVSKGHYESGTFDFGVKGKIKKIKSFTIRSEFGASVSIESEIEKKSFPIKGKKTLQTIRANVIGRSFKVKIEAEEKANIGNFVIKVVVPS